MVRYPRTRFARSLFRPATLDFWASHISSSWSCDRTLARVVSRRIEARDTVTLELQPNRHFAGFQPGQHVNLTVEVNGVRLTRSYSITSIPGPDRRLSLTIKAVPDGKVSQHLCNRLRVGDVVEIGEAYGDLVLPEDHSCPWLFVAAGSGITPIMSLIRALTARPLTADVSLMYWARTRSDLCFLAELHRLAGRDPRFHLHPILTRASNPLSRESTGRPAPEHFSALKGDLAERRTYACGPSGFVDRIEHLIGDRVDTFRSEAFTPREFDRETSGTVTVKHATRNETLELPAGVPLLTALEAAGVQPAYGCRMGVCNTCACAKDAGVTEDLRNGALEHETQSALKICVTAARTDLVLEW